ncbi:MAG: hypothetical protein ACE5H3_06765 [Planctomycetota bacterium]
MLSLLFLAGFLVLPGGREQDGLAGKADPPAQVPASSGVLDTVLEFQAADGTPLEAKLSVPAGRPGPFPVVFYLHGASVRSYDNPFPYRDEGGKVQWGNYLDFPARELARRGIAFFRMSKRGCHAVADPPSTSLDPKVFAQATPSVLLGDYAKGLEFLRGRSEIDPARIVLMGQSEGTRLAARLALKSPAGVIGVLMLGYECDNIRDTVVWQNRVGPWRNVQHLIPAARDGELTLEEWDAAVQAKPGIAQALPFDLLDGDQDGVLTAEDMEKVLRPRLDAILKAVEEGDDDFLTKNVVNLNSAYLREEWDGVPTREFLLKLAIPLAIFHGTLDGSCRVEGVQETDAAFRQAEKSNLAVHLYPRAGHDLDWTRESAAQGGPPAFRDAFAFIAELVRPKSPR